MCIIQYKLEKMSTISIIDNISINKSNNTQKGEKRREK